MYRLLLLATFLGGSFADHDSGHQTLPSACLMSPDTSDCGGNEQRWFYYADLKTCTEFTYKGCGNSENNFATKENCEKWCSESPEAETSIESDVTKQSESTDQKEDVINDGNKEAGDNTSSDVAKPAAEPEKVEGSDEDEEEIQEKLKVQEAIQQRFNMANRDDLLTLEQYMQDDNIDMADILDAAEAGALMDEDIRANMYIDGNEEEAEFEDEEPNEVEYEDQETEETVKEADAKQEIVKKSNVDKGNTKELNGEQGTTGSSDSNGSSYDELYLQHQMEEQGELQDRFNMANSDDMLALQEILQNPGMEVQDIEVENDENEAKERVSQNDEGKIDTIKIDIEGDINGDHTDDVAPEITIDIETGDSNQQTGNFEQATFYSNFNDEDDEEVADAEHRREQFSMADNDDYITLESLMSSPNMEVLETENTYAPNEQVQIQHIQFNHANGRNTNEATDSTTDKVKVDKEDTYGEHLDFSHAETSNNDDEEDEIDETLKFETELEQKFNMADRQDMLALEEILQDPNTEVAEVVPSENVGPAQDGDVKGVLSLAASFLGDNNIEEKDNLEHIQDDMRHLPEIARKPLEEAREEIHKDLNENRNTFGEKGTIDYTHPAELLKRQQMQENSQMPSNPIDIQSMAHDDKMMLMSLLHVDRLKFQRVAQTTPSLLDLVKEERENKLRNDMSPNEGFIDMISKKDGIPKCCLFHKDAGPCQEKTLQWHYDPVLQTCLPFFYGGCEGNDNRFDTIGECLRKCGFSDRETKKSSPEPIPEPPTYSNGPSSKNAFKAIVSKILPGKILSLRERMTPGQQKFIHKFIKSAINHVSDIKPMKIAQIPLAFGKFKVHENMVDRKSRLPMPIKSILFKWPILRMVFDKTIKDIKPMRDMKEMAEPIDNIFPMFPKEKKEYRRFKKDWGKRPRGDFQDFRKMSRDRNEFRDFRKSDRNNREEFEDYSKMGRYWSRDTDEEPEGRRSRHFSPSFKKSYKMKNHNEDKRHQISADPKNKVNLIQVFVNKPHTESHASPSHHHTMIKKEYSRPLEPQVEPPMPQPPAPPQLPHLQVAQPYPGYPAPPPQQVYGRRGPLQRPHPIHGAFSPKPSFLPQNFPAPRSFPPHHHHPPPPPHFHPLVHPQSAHPPHYHVHEHVHSSPPMMLPQYAPPMAPRLPPFIPPFKPWWARFGKPYFEPQFEHVSMRNEIQPEVIPSTKYPEKTEDSDEEEPTNSASEEVVFVDESPNKPDEGPHYSCLLPVSTGVCKAFEERYYFNKATGSCELFIYGGCGGNANNYASKKECGATCSQTFVEDTEMPETSTLPDDTIIITSPVYVPAEVDGTDQVKTVKEEVKAEDNKDISEQEVRELEIQENDDEEPAVKVEPMKLFKSSHTEYIIIITVMCFVGLSAVVLVALAIANLSRRLSKTKKEKVIEAVLSSHLDASSNGTLTPSRLSYYGHPPSELGPPPINEVLKVHKKDVDEQV